MMRPAPPSQPAEWRSSYLAEADSERTAAERVRTLGGLFVIAALFTAVGSILNCVNEAFPLDIVSYCGITALLGIALFVIASRRLQLGSWKRAALGLLPIVLVLAVMGSGASAIGYFVIYPKRVWERESKTFQSIEDHIDFMLRQTNSKLRQLAEDALYETYTPEEVENGYVNADMRAITRDDFTGKGFAICTARNPEERMAVVAFKNAHRDSLEIILEGPTSQKLTAAPSQITSARVRAGDYIITVSVSGKYIIPAVSAPKRIIGGGNYKAVIDLSRHGDFYTKSASFAKPRPAVPAAKQTGTAQPDSKKAQRMPGSPVPPSTP